MAAVKISLIADAEGVKRGVQQASDDLHGLRGHAAAAGEAIKSALEFTAVVVGVDKLTEAVKGSYEAFEQQEVIVRKTEQTIKDAGLQHVLTAKQVEENATALSRHTGISRDGIQTSENLLLRNKAFAAEIRKHPAYLKQQETSILNVAAANDKTGKSNIDLTQATKAYSRAIADPAAATGAFTKAGVALTAQQKDQVKALAKSGNTAKATSVLLADVASKVKGVAVASDTPTKQLAANMQILKEQLGAQLAKVITPVISVLAKWTTAISEGKGPVVALAKTIAHDLAPGFKFIEGAVKTAAHIIGGFFTDLRSGGSKASGFASSLRSSFTSLTRSIGAEFGLVKGFINSFVSGFKGANVNVGAAISALKLVVQSLAKVFSAVFAEAVRVVKAASAGFKQEFHGIGQVIGGLVNLVSDLIHGKWSAVWKDLGQIVKGAFNAIVGATRAFVSGFGKLLGDGFKAAGDLAWKEIKALPGQILTLDVKMLEAGQQLAKSIADGFVNELKKLPGQALDIVKGIPGRLKGAITGGPKGILKALFRGGGIAMAAGGLVPAMVSPGEALAYPGGGMGIVPGARVAADSVSMLLPSGTAVLTDSGQSIFAATGSMDAALRHQAPHFAKGGVIRGKVSTFGPPGEGAGPTAYGGSSSQAGIAVNPHMGSNTWNDALARSYAGKTLRVTVAGHSADLKVIDKGPSIPGRAIDITGAGVAKLGIPYGKFPTDAVGTAVLAGSAGAGGSSSSSSGSTRSGSTSALVSGAFSAGFQRGMSGIDDGDWGYAGVSAALGALSSANQNVTKATTARLKATGGLSSSAKAIPGVKSAIGKYAGQIRQKFGLQWPSIGQTTGGTHAPGSYHYQGRAVDLSGSPAAMAAAAAFVSSHTPSNLLEGIHKTGLSVKNGQHVPSSVWGSAVWNEHANHVHLAMRRGGVVGRFARGGVIKGGNNMLSSALSGGTSRGSLVGIAQAVQDATTAFVLAQITALEQQIPTLAGAARRTAQAHLSVLQDAEGSRIGRVLARAVGYGSALDQNTTSLSALQSIRGLDPNSSAALMQQQTTDQQWLKGAPSQYNAAQRNAALVARKYGANSSDAQAAQQVVTDLGNKMLQVSAQVADLGRSIAAAQLAEQEAARTAYQGGTGGASDLAGAAAALADAQSGNSNASRAYTQSRLAAVTAAEQAAQAAGDIPQATDLLNQEAQLTAALKQLDTTSQELADQQAQVADLTRQMVDNQNRLMAFAQNQSAALTGAIIAAVNGGIGGQVGLGVQAPGWAGAGARY